MPNLKSAWLLRIDEGGTLNRFAFLRTCVTLVALFFTRHFRRKGGEEELFIILWIKVESRIIRRC